MDAGLPKLFGTRALVAVLLVVASCGGGATSEFDAARSHVLVSSAGSIVADGTDSTTVTVELRNSDGAPLEGLRVRFDATGSGNSFSPSAGVANASGVIQSSFTSIVAETKSVRAIVETPSGDVLLPEQPTVDFVADASNLSASLSTIVASPSSGVVANGTDLSTITIVVRDANANPVAGQTVTIASDDANDVVVQPLLPTDSSGATQASVSTLAAGTKSISAIVDPGPSQVALANPATVAFIGDAANLSASLSTAVAAPNANVVANGVDLSTITVVVRDANGNPVPGRAVSIASDDPSDVLVQPPAPTDAAGGAQATIAATTAATKTVTVTIDAGPSQIVLSSQPTIDFIGDSASVSPSLSSVVASPSTNVVADGASVSTITVVVRDANGNPVPGRVVQLSSSGSNDSITQPAATTDANGSASGTIASTKAETKTIFATVDPSSSNVALAAQPTVDFIADAAHISPSLSSAVAAPNANVVADSASVSTITVVVRDVNGNLVPGRTVHLDSDGSNNSIAQPPSSTDASGAASGTIATTTAETKTITVSIDPSTSNVVLSTQPTIGFIGDGANVSAALSSVSASPNSNVVADGASVSVVTVVVRDVNGNAVPGRSVHLASSGANNSITEPASVTDASGTASGSIASTKAETKTITATVDPSSSNVTLSTQPTVGFIADVSKISSSLSSASAAPNANVVADGASVSTITVVVRDVNGNVVPGRAVHLASSGTSNSITEPASTTDATGTATGTIASTKAETKTITVSIDPSTSNVVLSTQPTIGFIGDPANISPSLSSAAASPSTNVVADGAVRSTITVVVRDVNDNAVPGRTVHFASDGSNNSIDQPASTTDATGTASGSIASTKAETKTITVSVDPSTTNVVLSTEPTIEFIGDAAHISASLSSASASPNANVVADGVELSTISVVVRDVNANPVAGRTVHLASSGTNNSISQPASTTDAFGAASGTIASIKAETKTVTVAVDPSTSNVVLADQPTIDFVADASHLSASLSTLVVSPSSDVVANALAVSTITVVARDVNGNVVPGRTVQLSSTGSNNALTQPASTTDASGTASGTIASTKAETKTIGAVLDPSTSNVALAAQPTVVFIGDAANISASLSSATVSPSSNVVANDVDLSTITVVVRDINGNAVSGRTVQLSSTGANNVLTEPRSATNSAGMTSGSIASLTAETKTISVVVDPSSSNVALSTHPTVDFIGDAANISASLSSVVASPNANVVANGGDVSTITVVVRDVNSNPVPGRTVRLASSGTNNSLTQPVVTTDATGTASGTLATTKAEAKTVGATVDPSSSNIALSTQPTVDFVADASNLSATLSSVTALPNAALISDGVESSTVTVVVRDQHGNLVSGVPVQLSSSGTSNLITQPSSPTDGSGTTSGSIASTKAEVKTLTAIADPGPSHVDLATHPQVEFLSDANDISVFLSSAAASPNTDVVANGVDVSTITVVVLDGHGNPVPGQTVTLASDDSSDVLVQPSSPTDLAGSAQGTISTLVAATKTITVTIDPGASQLVLQTRPTVVFIGDAANMSATLSSAVASPSANVVANGVDVSTITVVVRDANSNPVPDRAVRFSSSGTNDTLSQPSATTDANGTASGTIASTKAETKTITVVVDPGPSELTLSTQPTVDFIADASNVSASLSSAVASPTSGVVANGVDVSTITVVVRDVNGNLVPDRVVQLASSGTNNTLDQPASTTDASGTASGTIASTEAETKTITVTVDPNTSNVVLSTAPTIGFIGDAANISASLSSAVASPSANVVANGVDLSTISVVVRDVNGNAVPGRTVQLASSGSNNSLSQPGSVTDASGAASGSLATTTAETKTVTVEVDPGSSNVVLAAQPTVGFIGDSANVSASLSSVVASPNANVVANGIDLSTITVVVRDANGNPVSGRTVHLASSGSNNSIVQPSSTTDASGTASGTIASTKAETKTITATVDPGSSNIALSTQPSIGFVADASNISPTLSTAVASPSSNVVANGVDLSTITVVVRDVNGNLVSGRTVHLASSGTNNSIGQPASTTDANGAASGTIASTKAETKTITVSVDPNTSNVALSTQPSIGFIGDAANISASLSSASAAPSTNVVANGVDLSTITVVVRDVNGNVLSGRTVQLTSNGTNNSLTQPASTTNAAGSTSGTIASTKAETKTITVTVDPSSSNVALSTQPTIGFVADASNISASLSSASASPTSNVVANGVDVSTITVVVRDVNGNLVSGRTVHLASNGASNSLTQPASTTDASGTASGTIASTKAETKTITVTVDPNTSNVALSTQPTVGFIGDSANVSASLSSASASPSTNVVANGAALSTITVVVRDVNANVVPGRTVQLASSGTNNSLTQPASTTDASGTASGTIASIKAETKTITVTVDPNTSNVALATQPTIAFVGDPSNISASLSSASASPSSNIFANGVDVSTITVVVRDVNNNVLAGRTVQLASSGTNNTLTEPASTTNASGAASGTLATTTAETKTITATIDPNTSNVALSTHPTVAFIAPPAASASSSTISASPASGILADGVASSTITVTVIDQYGSPMAGRTVHLSATGTGDTLTQPASTTNASGVATGSIATTTAERKTITAVVDPGPSAVTLTHTTTATFIWPHVTRHYVRVSGSDVNTGSSPAQAWRTVSHAAAAVAAGDQVFVGGGTYQETVSVTTDGTSGSPIVFTGDSTGQWTGDAGEVVIDATNNGDVFQIDGADYITLDGFTLRSAPSGTGAGVHVGDTATNGVCIRNNRIIDNGRGIVSHNATNLVIESNRISRQRRGPAPPTASGGDGIYLDASNNAVVLNNLIYANEGVGVWLTAGSTGALIENNTLYADDGDDLYVDGLANSATVKNNVISSGAQNGIHLVAGSTLTSSYNISWNHGGSDWLGAALGTGDASSDPKLYLPSGLDGLLGGDDDADDQFQLDNLLGSPGFDAGSSTAISTLFSDGTSLAERTSRIDGTLDGTAPDGATINLGYHYAAPVGSLADLSSGDARLVRGHGSEFQPHISTWNDGGATWSADSLALPAGATLRWLIHKRSPLANSEEILGAQWASSTSTGFRVERWSGTAWNTEWSATGGSVSNANKRAFDLEYETSGDALAVWSDGTSSPKFRAFTKGAWSSAAAIFSSAPGSGNLRWVELACRPRSDEMTLVYADTASDLWTVVWDGSSWDTAHATRLETSLRTTTTRSFDVDYEQSSGDVLVVWAGPSGQARWSSRSAGSTNWSAVTTITGLGTTPAIYDLAADPSSDRIALIGLQDSTGGTEPWAAMWSGTAWQDAHALESGAGVTNGTASGDLNVAAGWVGSSGVAVAIYEDNTSGAIDWGRWSAGNGWSLQSDVAIAGKGTTQSIQIVADPTRNRLFAALSDSNSDIYVATYDGTNWVVTNGGAALETNVSSIASEPFALIVGGP